jgi:hypothetical protein
LKGRFSLYKNKQNRKYSRFYPRGRIETSSKEQNFIDSKNKIKVVTIMLPTNFVHSM